MAKQLSKQHAEHNEKACDYLHSCANFPDWVITTSFYSSLHYLRHKLFPFKIVVKKVPIKVEDFDHFHSVSNATGKRLGRHERFQKLVEDKCPKEISFNYVRLLELSNSARYTDYNYENIFVEDAKKKLNSIKAFCG
jgi:hypothetical protein